MNWFRRYPELRRGIVNMKSGTVFRGVVYRKAGPFLVLRQAEMLSDRDNKMKPQVMEGEVLVKLADIDFVQIGNGDH